MIELEPPDRERCQALRPNKTWSPFNLGPADMNPVTGEKRGGSRASDRHWRCNDKPVCIVQEIEADKDGVRGSMSLCSDCFVHLFIQDSGRAKIIEVLNQNLP